MGVTDFLLLSCLGFAITAHAQDCAVPVGGPNMHLKDEYILKDTFASGDQATFECDTGYSSAGGSSSITCTAGSWSTVSLKCERKNCGSPGELPNGQIDYPKENLFGDHIEITCDEGYRLVGKSTIICGAEGWMDRLPRCEEVVCDEAPQVKDAHSPPYKESYRFGDAVQYSCQKGFTLSGSASILCSNDGTFKPAPPTCTMVQCEDLDIPNLDWISGSRPPHGYMAKITYRCRTGFKMVGYPTLTCDINSQWSPGLPRCDRVICNRPPLVANGSFSPVKEVYNYRDVVQYSCQNGFRLSGSKSASCSGDGTFKPDPPTCTMVTCNPPPGTFSPVKEVYKYRDVVQYSCQKGFRLSGSASASCSDDGTFKPDPPTCTKIESSKDVAAEKPGIYCEEPHIKHGYLTHDARPPYRPNDRVKFECSTGYKMKGNPTLACQADGQWSPAPPEYVLAAICYILNRSGVGARIWRCLTDRRRKCLEGNDTSAEQEESLQDVKSQRERPPGNVAASGGTVDKSPVMSTNEV